MTTVQGVWIYRKTHKEEMPNTWTKTATSLRSLNKSYFQVTALLSQTMWIVRRMRVESSTVQRVCCYSRSWVEGAMIDPSSSEEESEEEHRHHHKHHHRHEEGEEGRNSHHRENRSDSHHHSHHRHEEHSGGLEVPASNASLPRYSITSALQSVLHTLTYCTFITYINILT